MTSSELARAAPTTLRGSERRRARAARARRPGAWKDPLRRRLLAAADVAALLGAALVTGWIEGSGTTTAWLIATVPVWIVLAKTRGLYDADHARVRHQTVDELSALFTWATMATATTALLMALAPAGALSARAALWLWGLALLLAFFLRGVGRSCWRRFVPPERGLVVGDGPLAQTLARKLALEAGHHVTVVGQTTISRPASNGNGVGPEGLAPLLREERIERVLVALQDLDERTLSTIAATCKTLGVKLSVAPPLRAMFGTAVHLNHLAELPLIEFRTWDPSRSTLLLKRSIDLVLASLLLVLAAPVLALTAVVIRLDSPGPILFRQRRAGREGKPFRVLKFRTMAADAESRLADVISLDSLAAPMFKLRADPRVTRVGRFLRRWSIDELPQLVNVIRGEMSLCGPRPEELWLVERYEPSQRFRLEMRPGISGPMQVHGRGELTFDERLSVEREYVENYSLGKDLEILVRTVPVVVRRQGAF